MNKHCQCKMQMTFKDEHIISECLLCGDIIMQTKPYTVSTPPLTLEPIKHELKGTPISAQD